MVIGIYYVHYIVCLIACFPHCLTLWGFSLGNVVSAVPSERCCGLGPRADHGLETCALYKILWMILTCSTNLCTLSNRMQTKSCHLNVTKTEGINQPKMKCVSLTVSLNLYLLTGQGKTHFSRATDERMVHFGEIQLIFLIFFFQDSTFSNVTCAC